MEKADPHPLGGADWWAGPEWQAEAACFCPETSLSSVCQTRSPLWNRGWVPSLAACSLAEEEPCVAVCRNTHAHTHTHTYVHARAAGPLNGMVCTVRGTGVQRM